MVFQLLKFQPLLPPSEMAENPESCGEDVDDCGVGDGRVQGGKEQRLFLPK